MSILNVEHLTHGFGDRAIFNDVSFRLLKGEHIGLVGANGEGKSTFMSIVTGKLMPDEGKVEWAKNVHAGYLDQHAVLEKGMMIRQALKSAFDPLLQKEQRMNEICDMLGTADEEEMNLLMEELGTIQDELTLHDFYTIDAKVEEVARALGLLDLGLDRDVTDLSGGQRTKVLLAKLLLEKPDILLLDEPTNYLDEEHIAWLKRYLLDYENAFILISHDIPFLNEVVNIIYHMENQELNRYVGDYDHFKEVHAVQKAQIEAAYNRQQQEIAQLKDFVARNKARVATRNMAMSRQKKLDKMDVIELAAERPKPEFHFKYGRTPGKMLFETKDLVTGYDEPLLQTMYVDKGLSDIKAVQTLSRLNRCYPNKNEVFVLDFQNDPADIKTAFDKYYKTTILSGETDVNKLNDLVDEMEPLDVYSDEEVTEVAELYLDNADRTKIDPIIDKGTERYKELEYDDQVDFKSSAKTFLRTYNFLSSILPYGSMDWERLSIYLTFLVSKLPKPDNGNADEIVEDVELESYRLVAQDTISIKLEDKDSEIEPIPVKTDVGIPVPELDTLSNILASFHEMWGNCEWTDEDRIRKQIAELPDIVEQDETYQNAMKYSDAQNARDESDRATYDAILKKQYNGTSRYIYICLLYTSDAADE